MTIKPDSLRYINTQTTNMRGAILLTYIIVAGLLFLLLSISTFPLLSNYVNHIARIFIQLNLETDPHLAANYQVRLAVLPNLALEFVVIPLAQILPLELAGRLFIWLVFLSQLAGTALLHRALFKTWSWWPLLTLFFLFGATLRAGYMNFSFGLGLMLLTSAVWIVLRERSWALRLVVGSLLSVALYFCHIFAVAAYLLMIGSYELVRFLKLPSDVRTWRTLLQVALQLGLQTVVPLVLFDLFSPLTEAEFVYDPGELSRKLIMLLSPVLNYNLILDLVTVVILAGGTVFLAVKKYMEVSLFAVPALGILLLLFVISPRSVLGTGYIDVRFIQLAALIFAASIEFNIPSHTWKRVVGAGLVLLLLVRYAIIAVNMTQFDQDVIEIRRAFAEVERGSKVLVVYAMDRDSTQQSWRRLPQRHYNFLRLPSLVQATALGVMEKSVFVPHIHMEAGKQLIAPAENVADITSKGYYATLHDLEISLKQPGAQGAQLSRLESWPERFDYLAVLNPRHGSGVLALGSVDPDPLYEGELIAVYRISQP